MAQWLHPTSAPFPAQDYSLTPAYWLAQPIQIRDTNPHDYTTDGGSAQSPGPMFLQMVAAEVPRVVAYAIWSANGLDKTVTVQPIANVVYDQSQPDFLLGSPATVLAGATDWLFAAFDSGPVEFLGAQVTATVMPTTGSFSAVLYLYQDTPQERAVEDGTSGPIFPQTLAGLADVDIVNPMNNDILVYDSATGKWYNSPTVPVTAGVESVNGLAGALTLASANTGIGVASATATVTLTLGAIDKGTLWGGAFASGVTPAKGDVVYNDGTVWNDLPTTGASDGYLLTLASGVPSWAPAPASGVASLNGLTGALSVTSPDSSIGVTASSPDIEIEVSAVANGVLSGPVVTGLTTETAAGITLTASGSGVGAYYYTPSLALGGDLSGSSLGNATVANLQTYTLTLGSPSSNQVIAWNGSAWVNAAVPATAGVTSAVSGNGVHVSSATGAVTFSAVLNGTTLSNGASGLSLNLANANLWAAAQRFPSSDLLIGNPAATYAYTLVGAAITAARNLTLPLITGADTLAALGVAQTFSALQTFLATGGTNGLLVTSSATATAIVNEGLEVIEVGNPLTIAGVTYGVSANTNSPAFGGFAARGTVASPAAVQAGDLLLSLKAGGYNGTAWFTGAKAAFRAYAGETWSTTASGTYLTFHTTVNATTTGVERMRLTGTGGLLLYNPAGTQSYTIVGAALAASHTLNLPLITTDDTFAVIGTVQNWTAIPGQTLYTFNTNTAWGTGALAVNAVPQAFNTAFGASAMAALGAGNGGGNSAFGYAALGGLGNMTTGGGDAFGEGAGQALTTGSVAAFGAGSALSVTSGIYNSAFGEGALQSETTGQENVAIGFYALGLQKGAGQNVAVGTASGRFNRTGLGNVSMGHDSFHNGGAGGSGNGSYNVVIGWTAMEYDSTEVLTGCVVVGAEALNQYADTSNGNSVAIGYRAGYSIITGSQNVILGYNADAIPNGSSGMLNIANWIFGTGLTGTGSTLPTGAKIGIGTLTPGYTLDVNGAVHAEAGFYGELDSADLDGVPFSFATLNAGDVLTYNGSDWTNMPGSGTTVFDTNTSLTGANTYGNVIVTDGATLTLNIASTTTISGTLTVNPGCSLVMNGATLSAQTLANSGTLTSSSGVDSLSFQNSAHDGTTSVAGTLYLLAGSHVVTTSISGAGTTNVAAGATLSVPAGYTATFSCAALAGTGTVSISATATLDLNVSLTLTGSTPTLTGAGTLSVGSTYTLTYGASLSLSLGTVTGAGALAFGANTMTVTANETWSFTGGYTASGTLTVTGATLTLGASYTVGFATVNGTGTVSVSNTYTWTAGGALNLSVATLTGAGTAAFGANTITVTSSTTWSVASYTASGTLTVTGAAVVVTLGASYTIGFGTVGGTGQVSVSGGFTWTAGAGVTMNIPALKGAGTVAFGANTVTISAAPAISWTVASYTASGELLLTASASLQLNATYTLGFTSIVVTVGTQPTVTGSGTITVSAGLAISATSGTPLFQLNVGVLAGASTITFSTPTTVNAAAQTLTFTGNVVVTGTSTFVVWIDNRFTRGTGSGGTVTNPIGTITGTGLFLAAPGISATATSTVTLGSGTSILAGGVGLPTNTGTTHPAHVTDVAGTTTWSANATGVYYLGFEDTTGSTYALFLYVYFGTSSNAFVLVNQWVNTWSDSQNTNTDTFRPYSSSASAGTITTGGGNTLFAF